MENVKAGAIRRQKRRSPWHNRWESYSYIHLGKDPEMLL
jgi:hypothetical protein